MNYINIYTKCKFVIKNLKFYKIFAKNKTPKMLIRFKNTSALRILKLKTT